MNNFEQNVIQICGERGRKWLDSLPALVDLISKQWQLTDLVPAKNLSYNYVMLGKQDARPVVLKLAFDKKALEQEIAALTTYQGNGCIRLLATDLAQCALLEECAVPGTSLKQFFPEQEAQAVEYAAQVMKTLHAVPVSHPEQFQTIQDWLKLLHNPHPALSKYHINKARNLADHLVATQAKPVLLHGDLHHDNILLSGNEWIAIDPKGVLGESAYEVGAFIRNPFPELLDQPNPKEIMLERLALFSHHLKIDQNRLQQWSYVQAVLAACWAMEDGQTDPAQAMIEATLLLDTNE